MEIKIKINELDSENIRCIMSDFFFMLGCEYSDIDDFRYDELDATLDIAEFVNNCPQDMAERCIDFIDKNLDYCIAKAVWQKILDKLEGCSEFDYNDVDLILSMLDKEDLEKTKELITKNIKNK